MPMRSRDLLPAYAINGVYHPIEPEQLRSTRLFSDAMVPLVMHEPEESLDINKQVCRA
jgi:hypothetical protein